MFQPPEDDEYIGFSSAMPDDSRYRREQLIHRAARNKVTTDEYQAADKWWESLSSQQKQQAAIVVLQNCKGTGKEIFILAFINKDYITNMWNW